MQVTDSSAGWRTRVRTALSVGWGAVTGAAPHVLHHVGPLAGTAVVAGAGGKVLFFGIGFLATVPLLLRLRRRFRSWMAPALAAALFMVAFVLSSLIVGTLLGDTNDGATATTHGHEH